MTDKDSKAENIKSGQADEEATKPTSQPANASAEVTKDDAQASTGVIDTQVIAPTEVAEAASRQAGSQRSVSTPLAAMQPGYMLKDRFRLEEKLGAGAMGAVFRAVDQRRVETRHHDPNVAIKLIAGDFSADSRAFIALQRETDKSQTLAHPNIITVYDFDRDGDLFFMTMESLAGVTLDKYIEDGEGDRKQRLTYIEDMANAVAYAHRREIVHSDLKPQNIFVTTQGTLKVLDFGIARAVSAMDGQARANKDPGEITGLTPTYASCEMFEKCEPHPSDDVYALGLIAYEMLSGEHPFGRKKATQAKAEALKPKKIKGLHSYQWQAISKALVFERAGRWQDAEAFRRKFTGTGRRVHQLSAALLVAVVSFAAYFMLYQPEAGPDIPFDELPAATQQEFNTALSEGQQALRFGDLNGAFFYFDEAYGLHPRNARVMQEFDALLDKVLANMQPGAPAEQQRRYLFQVEELQKYESLQQNPRLADKRKALQQRLE